MLAFLECRVRNSESKKVLFSCAHPKPLRSYFLSFVHNNRKKQSSKTKDEVDACDPTLDCRDNYGKVPPSPYQGLSRNEIAFGRAVNANTRMNATTLSSAWILKLRRPAKSLPTIITNATCTRVASKKAESAMDPTSFVATISRARGSRTRDNLGIVRGLVSPLADGADPISRICPPA